MSEQSPWGTPPPSNPYGPPQPQQPQQPTPTPYPQQPPYQTGSTGGGWSGGGPGYGSTYGGPPSQPPKKRTGLIVGIVAAVVLVVAALVVALVVTSGGDDEPDVADSSATASDTPSSSDPTESSEPTTEPTSEPTTEPTTDGGTDDIETVTGDGYVVALPASGWTDQTAAAGDLGGGETIDTVIVLGRSIQLAQSNIIVEALDAGNASSLEDLAPLWKRNLSGSDNATPEDIPETTIDGERAIGVEINDRVNANGDPIKQIAYLTIHDGKQYSIGLSYPASGDTVSKSDFEIFMASWTWIS